MLIKNKVNDVKFYIEEAKENIGVASFTEVSYSILFSVVNSEGHFKNHFEVESVKEAKEIVRTLFPENYSVTNSIENISKPISLQVEVLLP